MPLYINKEQWDAWVKSKEVIEKEKGRDRYLVGVVGEPASYPCYCLSTYQTHDFHDDRIICMFIYPKYPQEPGQDITWDLEKFEKREWD